eukprot:4978553-Ditylum_brightwellii.AAC.1
MEKYDKTYTDGQDTQFLPELPGMDEHLFGDQGLDYTLSRELLGGTTSWAKVVRLVIAPPSES